MQSLVNSQLYVWEEQNNNINIEQCRIFNHRSTQDKLFRLIQVFNRKHSTSTDLVKIFDHVWYNGLRHQRLSIDTPTHLLRWISNFPTERSNEVTMNGKASETNFGNYGIPQGSPLPYR